MSGKYFKAPETHDDEDRLLLYRGQHLLVCGDRLTWRYRDIAAVLEVSRPSILIESDERHCYFAIDLGAKDPLPENGELIPLWQLLTERQAVDFRVPGLGNQLTSWYRSHRYCGSCGTENSPHPHERAMRCHGCGISTYPRINPCVIVLVIDGERMLLARHTRYRINMYSCLAGFIEAGETPEQTVQREIREEAAIEVDNIRYIRSQSWPFPSQLMLGFYADYAGGELQPEPGEIDDLRWFTADDLPRRPSAKLSVAGYLIDAFLQGRR